jgi:hypothetical protein
VELREDRIVQVRGQNNCAATSEVQLFLDAWTRKKLQKPSGPKAA